MKKKIGKTVCLMLFLLIGSTGFSSVVHGQGIVGKSQGTVYLKKKQTTPEPPGGGSGTGSGKLPSTGSTTKPTGSSGGKTYPQTGEVIKAGISIAGVVIILGSFFIWWKRRKKDEESMKK